MITVETGASDEERKRTPPPIEIRLEPKDRIMWTGESLSAKSSDTGEIVIPGALDDEYWVTVSAVPSGFYVKSVTAAGRDVYSKPFIRR